MRRSRTIESAIASFRVSRGRPARPPTGSPTPRRVGFLCR